MAQDRETLKSSVSKSLAAGAQHLSAQERNLVHLSSKKLEGRQRQITATIQIPRSLESVWQILTDYDGLATFIPNLTKSKRLPHPAGGIRLEQIGAQCFLNIQFCARVVLDMYERFPHELGFKMVEGDFKLFQGAWRLTHLGTEEHPVTQLSYELLVQPPLAMPMALIESHLRSNLSENLTAIRQRAVAFAR
ncbi:MAG: SRPBCC family protein [Cyanobacteria bacterium P01_H01_bin.119]